MKVVLDTSAIIYLNDFRNFTEMYTISEAIDEIKDRISNVKLSTLNLKIVEPSEEFVDAVKKIAKETGDLEKLSKTDLKLLALSKEKNLTIISDDRNIQNVAEKLGIKYLSIFSKAITKQITWRNYCKNCNKYFVREKICSTCGEKLIRVPKESVEIG